MSDKQIKFTIGRGGKVFSEGLGYTGTECLNDLQMFLAAGLGDVGNVSLKPEAFVSIGILVQELEVDR